VELGDFAEGVFEPVVVEGGRLVARRLGRFDFDGVGGPLVVTKTLSFGGGRTDPSLELQVAVENPGDSEVAFELAIEWNVNLLGGGHNPAAYYETESGERTPHDVEGEAASASTLAFGNDYEGVRVEAHATPAARLTWYPVETVSNSEGGFERVYQGSSLHFRWPVSLAPGDRLTRAINFGVAQTIDHSADERA
jgi:hypothetical protein